ncbi:MAG: rhomboid family intramembrane serine protease [Armatimonadota bacterium]|nr:rhomboid family intramembrane serine protease [Armatimonadota bacterium]
MIPLRDSTRSRTTPVVVYGLIAVSVAVFLHTLGLESQGSLRAIYDTYGVVPRAVSGGPGQAWMGLVTSMFLHGSWVHLGGNMLYLWVFGDNVEDAMGHAAFLVFYLLTGTLAALAHVVTHPASATPLVGASGAIAGVLGAYFVLYPRARILSLVFVVFLIRLVELPASLVLLLWFVLQVFQGVAALAAPHVETVAWWAHVGGFVAGAVLVPLFVRR